MSIKFINEGTTVRVIRMNDEQVTEKLKPAIYTVQYSEMSGFFLSVTKDRFDVPTPVYGKTTSKAEKILRAYDERKKSTGVMMTGTKGAGKTLLSEVTANMMVDRGLPVLIINSPYTGDNFNDFMNNIGESVCLFDEFAKVYGDGREDENRQNGLLTLMDGVGSIKRLLILTENNEFLINDFIKNRPGRVLYHFRYKKLEEEVITEFCESKSVDQQVVDQIIAIVRGLHEFSFDVLSTIVEEHHRYPEESIENICEELNVDIGADIKTYITVDKVIDVDTGEEAFEIIDPTLTLNHLMSGPSFNYFETEEDKHDTDGGESTCYSVRGNKLKYDDGLNMIFEDANHRVICRVIPPPSKLNYMDFVS